MWDYLEKFYLLPFKICENLSKYAKTFQNMQKKEHSILKIIVIHIE